MCVRGLHTLDPRRSQLPTARMMVLVCISCITCNTNKPINALADCLAPSNVIIKFYDGNKLESPSSSTVCWPCNPAGLIRNILGTQFLMTRTILISMYAGDMENMNFFDNRKSRLVDRTPAMIGCDQSGRIFAKILKQI